MHTVETQLFSFDELSEETQVKVIQRLSEEVYEDPDDFTLSEGMESLHKIAEALGTKLADWSVGPYNRGNFVKLDVPYWTGELWDGGHKTQAVFLRLLIDHGYPRPKRFADLKFEGVCGFTGVCFDDDLAEEIWDALIDGETLNKAFDRAGDRLATISENDLDWRASKEGILESLDRGEEIYTKEGDLF